jgi:hypothetical protein
MNWLSLMLAHQLSLGPQLPDRQSYHTCQSLVFRRCAGWRELIGFPVETKKIICSLRSWLVLEILQLRKCFNFSSILKRSAKKDKQFKH